MSNGSKKRKQRRSVSLPEITLTPLIDVVLTVLIIFMLTAPMMHSVIKVDVPKAKSQAPQDFTQDSIVLNVGYKKAPKGAVKNFEYTVNNRDIVEDRLEKEIKVLVGKRPRNRTVYICADKTLPYDMVIKTFDRISAVEGVDHVALVTQKTS
jgi:biopolymer transport protein ExbD